MLYELLTEALQVEMQWRFERTQTLTLTFLGHFPPDRPQIKILPDDSPACLGSFLFRLTRNKAGATELVPLLSLLHRPSRCMHASAHHGARPLHRCRCCASSRPSR
jgi:hypothetical protein